MYLQQTASIECKMRRGFSQSHLHYCFGRIESSALSENVLKPEIFSGITLKANMSVLDTVVLRVSQTSCGISFLFFKSV